MTAVISQEEPSRNQMVQDLIEAKILIPVVDWEKGTSCGGHFDATLLAWSLLFGVSEFRLIEEADYFTYKSVGFKKGSDLAKSAVANHRALVDQYNTEDPYIIMWHEARRRNIF